MVDDRTKINEINPRSEFYAYKSKTESEKNLGRSEDLR